MNDSTATRDAWARRVQALLAKAESTPYPEEAEALLAKAQALMERHAIDESVLRAAKGRPEEITSVSEVISPPYASARTALLGAVAAANGCRFVVCSSGRGAQHGVIVGRPSDLDRTRTLFAALSLHATRAMGRAAVPPGDGARRFRHAFLLSFAARIGQRLQEAVDASRAEAAEEQGRSVALVLAQRDDEVERALRREFPRLGTRRSTASSAAGVHSGRRAADQAPLAQGGLGGRRALHR